jgi:hypothetical protein
MYLIELGRQASVSWPKVISIGRRKIPVLVQTWTRASRLVDEHATIAPRRVPRFGGKIQRISIISSFVYLWAYLLSHSSAIYTKTAGNWELKFTGDLGVIVIIHNLTYWHKNSEILYFFRCSMRKQNAHQKL